MTDPNQSRKERGVDAVNQEFRRYEQVRKAQSYRLSEAEDEAFDDDFEIRICDMRPFLEGSEEGKRAFAEQLGAALERIGFAILVGHGVDPALYANADRKVVEFFETIPEAERRPYLARRHGSVNQGYFPIRETSNI
ncbi:MAG: 2-oxoglutarate and iron-dependent oxygenase domain-containing protein, partial [Xanthomonadales bacterium]|nr:2-oxoglutarate and iron-dependent oxygenase domain-containing protein [Xanthomonadales bacterium]